MPKLLDLLTPENNLVFAETSQGNAVTLERLPSPTTVVYEMSPVFINFADGREHWRILRLGRQVMDDETGKYVGFCTEKHYDGDTQRWIPQANSALVELIDEASREDFEWGQVLFEDKGSKYYQANLGDHVMRKQVALSNGRTMIGVLVPYTLAMVGPGKDLYDLDFFIQYRIVVTEGSGNTRSKERTPQFAFGGFFIPDHK